MRVIIVDDEKPSLELIKIIFSKNKSLNIIGEYTNPNEALKGIFKLQPDAVFVDVEMPNMSGIEFAHEVIKFSDKIQIVFLTAYEKYAIDAFKVNAVNYILKPITEEDLNITVSRLLKNLKLNNMISKENKENQIFCLGYFKAYGRSGSEIIKWSTSKVKELFAYFIYNRGEEIDKWELCDMLWRESPVKKAEHNLHSSVYRLRTALKDNSIKDIVYYENGKYRVDFESFNCDAWNFQQFMEKNTLVNDENIKKYEDILGTYNGNLFGNEDYMWKTNLDEKLNRYYISGTKKAAEYYMEKKKYNEAEEYLLKALNMDLFDEEAHDLIMRTYSGLGDRIKLMEHYCKMEQMLKKELHILPRESTRKLYKDLLKNM